MSRKALSTIFELAAHSVGANNSWPLDKSDYIGRSRRFGSARKVFTKSDLWNAIASYSKGQMKKDIALIDAVAQNDLEAVMAAIEDGANVDPADSPYYQYEGEPLFKALLAAGCDRYDQDENFEIIKYLVKQGAPIGADELYFAMDNEGYGDDEDAMLKCADRVSDFIFEESKKSFAEADYTELLFEYQNSRARPEVMKKLIACGANPNCTDDLVKFVHKTAGIKTGLNPFSRPETSTLASLNARSLPLHHWVTCLLKEDEMVAENVMDRGHCRKVIDVLLDCGADPSVFLDAKNNLYETNEGYKKLEECNLPFFEIPVYKVTDEERKALQSILNERASLGIKQTNNLNPK